jgi:hypothetical protein
LRRAFLRETFFLTFFLAAGREIISLGPGL